MGDRELLEAAAKAAGLKVLAQPAYAWPALAVEDVEYGHDSWHPLADDGDALRLAVKLEMSVEISEYEGSTYAYAGNVPRVYAMENWSGDKPSATRRAIVRAAASMAGKGTTE